jgi:hypothetical protein
VSHLHSVDPPPSLPENDLARRVMLQQTVSAMLEHEPPTVTCDGDRLALLQSRLGDVAHAFLHGHSDVDAEILQLWASCQAWAEARSREAAR